MSIQERPSSGHLLPKEKDERAIQLRSKLLTVANGVCVFGFRVVLENARGQFRF